MIAVRRGMLRVFALLRVAFSGLVNLNKFFVNGVILQAIKQASMHLHKLYLPHNQISGERAFQNFSNLFIS